MRSSLALLALASTALPAAAQQVLFFHQDNLTPVPPLHDSVGDAVAHLCAGPTPEERAHGLVSHVPPGTRLLAHRRNGDRVQLVFDAKLATPAPGCQLEHAIEQIDKTALSASGVRHVEILVEDARGLIVDLRTAFGEVLPGPVGAAAATPQLFASFVAPFGALAGKRIAVSPGHGYYWHSTLGWTTQRGIIDGLIEDIHTAEICNQYLIPFLQNLGADVVMCREHGEVAVDGLVDNDAGAPGYAETGSWTTSTSSGYGSGGYRFATANAVLETATATWTIPVAEAGLYPVFVWYRAGSNRSTTTRYRIEHTGGIADVVVDQTLDDRTWAHLGNFWFAPAGGAKVTLSNLASTPGVVIADTVRLGGGLGSLVRGGTTSNQARWRECARYWTQFAGAPSTVYDSVPTGQDNDDDVTARPRFAEWRTADAFVSLHTNAGGGSGTNTFIYNGGATPGSAGLSAAVHAQLIADLQTHWNPNWVDRGQSSANFGEVRLLSTMPGILVELAFHDTPGSMDHTALHDPDFRYLAARAYARGVLRYFFPLAPFPPEPPNALRVTQDGSRGLLVAWDAAAGATSYTVEQSLDGKGFTTVATVATTSWSTGPLPHHSLRSFRVRAWNGTGRSFPTETLCAGTDHRGTAQLLLVQAFDRLDRSVKGPDNTKDYLPRLGDAIRRDARWSLGFDAATNEAVTLGRVMLGSYDALVWSLGEESTADESFSAFEQLLVGSYLNAGGRILVHGSEVGWDLDAQGSTSDRAFYRSVLGATYVADDAAVYTLQAGLPGTVSAGTPAGGFDDGTGETYDVDYPDVLSPTNSNSTTCLRYGNGLAAGVQRIDPATGARTVVFGLPLETIGDGNLRARLVQQSLAFLLAPMPLQAAVSSTPIGTSTTLQLTMPGEANRGYLLVASESVQPGLVLPGGGVLPVAFDVLFALSLTPDPIFQDFTGFLDGLGQATATVNVPYYPPIVGLSACFSALTFDDVGTAEHAITNWVRITLTP